MDDINTQVDDSSNTWPLIFLIFITSDLLHSIDFIYSYGYTLNQVIISVHIQNLASFSLFVQPFAHCFSW